MNSSAVLSNNFKTIKLVQLDLEYRLDSNFEINTLNSYFYIERLKELNLLPFSKEKIFYTDNTWDFSSFTKLNIDRSKLKISFNNVVESYRNELKNYVVIKILENKNKIQTIHKNCLYIRKFFNFLYINNYFDIRDCNVIIIKAFLKTQSQSIRGQRIVKSAIKDFYNAYSTNFSDILTKEIINIFVENNPQAYKAIVEQNKIPDIQIDFFTAFIKACLDIVNNVDAPSEIKAIASLYLIISQTGLRIGEILSIEINSLKTTKIDNGENANYILYKTWKREHGNDIYSIEKTYINSIAKLGYNTLLKLHENKRKILNMNYLYMGTKGVAKFPVDANSFRPISRRFYMYISENYYNLINLPNNKWPELSRINITYDKAFLKRHPAAETLCCPTNHQFRVRVCTDLYNKGVPLKYIEKFMGHLSSEMQGYYVRPKISEQENINFSLNALKTIVKGETKLLGASQSLMIKIQEFIIANNYNVATDLDEICNRLIKKIPIRQKTGGVCIKSSMLRECSIDAKTNDFYCAYGVCPNIFHFYYMVDISYRQSKELIETITINKERGFLKQVQKELNMLHTIVTNKLIPELDELNITISKIGEKTIIETHPFLKEIINNYDDIYKEAIKWKSLKILD